MLAQQRWGKGGHYLYVLLVLCTLAPGVQSLPTFSMFDRASYTFHIMSLHC